MKALLKNESVETINYDQRRSIFTSNDWEVEIYSDNLPENAIISITVTDEDLQSRWDDVDTDYYGIEIGKTTYAYWFENCSEAEFSEYVGNVALQIAREFDKDGNLEYEIKNKFNDPFSDMLRNLFN
jgi:hypothetical protein